MSEQKSYKIQTRASESQLKARQNLQELFMYSPLEPDHLLVNLALYMRSSVVAKILYVNKLYQHIIHTPGVIMEFGVWWGANLALFESLRAIYEPYNHARKIIGFDTFAGYPAIRPEDGESELATIGGYAVTPNYEEYLKQIL